jgi:hypothetical protein
MPLTPFLLYPNQRINQDNGWELLQFTIAFVVARRRAALDLVPGAQIIPLRPHEFPSRH